MKTTGNGASQSGRTTAKPRTVKAVLQKADPQALF
jgi:hypothetical protein